MNPREVLGAKYIAIVASGANAPIDVGVELHLAVGVGVHACGRRRAVD